MQHGVVFPREQRIDAKTGFGGDVFETAAHQFMRDKDFALSLRQLFERFVQRIEEQIPCVSCLGTGVLRREKVFERVAAVFGRPWIVERAGFLSAEEIDHPISGDAKKPCGYMLDRLHETVGLKQFVEDVLQDVLSFAGVGDVLS